YSLCPDIFVAEATVTRPDLSVVVGLPYPPLLPRGELASFSIKKYLKLIRSPSGPATTDPPAVSPPRSIPGTVPGGGTRQPALLRPVSPAPLAGPHPRLLAGLEPRGLQDRASGTRMPTNGCGATPWRRASGNIRDFLGLRFADEFPKAMVRMSSVAVKTGEQGEIRRRCSRINRRL
ncbi:unnamed protein product, partial [Urochloa humidicola]